MNRRSLIFLSGLALAIASCAPSDGEDDGGSSPPIGFELAAFEADAETGAIAVVDLSVEEVELAREHEDVRLIDIRRDDEIALGMIPGAEHVPMEEFDPAKVMAGDERPIILYCRSGRRSRIVGEQLAAYSGKPAIHLEGGILAWQEAGRRIVTP